MKISIHKLVLFCTFFVLNAISIQAQIGINTTDPEGALDIVSTDQGVVMPRVSAVENVVTPDGSPAVDGTIVYDLFRQQMCMRIAGAWVCTDVTGANTVVNDITPYAAVDSYIKSSNSEAGDNFGSAISISADGNYLAIGAERESSNATGINGDQTNNSASASGAVYIFIRSGSTWIQQAYIKASNAEAGDIFGRSVSISGDGSYLAVGATGEDSNLTGVNATGGGFANNSGAVYVFSRSGTTWTQQAYIKASNTQTSDSFGVAVNLSSDGSYLAVTASGEDSNATGVNGDETNNSASGAGAVYVFYRSGTTWSQQAYIKASNTGFSDFFGGNIILSGDGTYLAISAVGEDSNATGINGNQSNNFASSAGAVYVFIRSGTTWTQQAYVKSSNTDSGDSFGTSLGMNSDGDMLAVGAVNEDSNAIGVNGDDTDDSVSNSGAVYIFSRSGTTWTQTWYVKASNSETFDNFGRSIALSGDGTRLAVAADGEDSIATGINGDETDNSINASGAVYSFTFSGPNFSQDTYIKATNTDANDNFGLLLAYTSNGSRLLVATDNEDSNATGIGGDQTNNLALNSGAAYIIE